MSPHLGELAALGSAVCFTFTSLAFESAGKRVGSLSVSYIRLFIAFVFVSLSAYFTRGIAFPVDATVYNWIWLLISGLIGFVLGDLFLFQAYVEIGSRVSLLIMSAAPPLTALIGYLVLKETISLLGIAGMFTTMAGISLVILSKNPGEKRVEFNRPIKRIVFACMGALGQSVGLLCSKIGMGFYNPFAAAQIRLIAGVIGCSIVITVREKWPEMKAALSDKLALQRITLGAILGPFIGVTLSLIAVTYTATGIVSSIASVSPIIIIPASIVIFKEKVLAKEVLGAFIAAVGVAVLFL